MKLITIHVASLIIMLVTFNLAFALDQQMINVDVNVVAPACTINEGRNIDVNFGNDLITTRIDGSYRKTEIKYTASCISKSMKLKVSGNAASFNSELLGSSTPDLAIKILNNANIQPVNSWSSFEYPALPRLEAVLVKKDGAVLKAGPFSASATLMVDYQ